MDTRTKILLTGFEPFGELLENPSQVVAETLTQQGIEGIDIRCIILPVEFIAARERIVNFYQGDWFPNIIIHLGVANSRNTITLERFAVNMMDTANGDSTGYCPDEVPIICKAPLAYQTTIPCKQIIQYLRDKDIEAKISNTAGTYVCNTVLFTSLHILSNDASVIPPDTTGNVQCGFIHLPPFEKVDKNLQLTTVKTIIQWLKENQQQEYQDYLSHGNVQ